MTSTSNSGLALSLAASSLISEQDSQRFSSQAKAQRKPLTTFLIENQILSSRELADFCEQEYGVPLLDLDAFELGDIPPKYINQKLIEKHHALPIYLQGHTLYIAMADPTNVAALEEFGFNFGLHTEALLVEEEKLVRAIGKLLEHDQENLNVDDIDDADISGLEVADEQSRLDETVNSSDDDAPIVKYINKIMMDAIRRGASDLHFEPYEHKYRIRFRIDGILHEAATPPVNLASRFAARLKVMARLDIAERRLPQDGRIKLKLSRNRAMDMRVNTLPTMWGEKVVIRLLDSSAARLNIDQLGFDEEQKQLYQTALARPQGMILVTGPTGSGKTVTLYTGLNLLNTVERNISTAEDPIEINLPGVNQVQINPKAGLTFAGALRAFLRQDPDVVMVGEIRDLETAEIAIKAAQTGHLVLSTLHTNSAAETLTRMMNMGVPAFNIASSVTLIMAQRLARKLCEHCKQPDNIPEGELLKLGYSVQQVAAGIRLYRPCGCKECSGGYRGRIGIYEILSMSDNIARIIMQGGNSLLIAAQAQKEGMRTLRQAGLEKARLGITSLAEINRVTTN
ncbi:type IV-A pilus assembly ATPase PilB [Aeromonas simiae]|uniref:type IV-A pilus assembly ATPase PilB n=1 Tax=Aeromonas simiae TaxID=218936 RepID=UPI0005AADFB1|nr:type IV-A pilus assembly ATPase PilB [Aeromonas simiae]MDO2948254.1 type IV-A pilus assembly ATPase PilB [Aeromonas simiae]MDO2951735.1 type IV-A pilus assembly ATPase PilB [Aeromonas simiae]MDO2955557.1 type IV-A pilus assembly ATPase PilB [Aeromonas simiae]